MPGEHGADGIFSEQRVQLVAVAEGVVVLHGVGVDLRGREEFGVREHEDRRGAPVLLEVAPQPLELFALDRIFVAVGVRVERDEVRAPGVERSVEIPVPFRELGLGIRNRRDRGAGRARRVVGPVDLVVSRRVEERHARACGERRERIVLARELGGRVPVAVEGVARPEDEVGTDQPRLVEHGPRDPRHRRALPGRPIVPSHDEDQVRRTRRRRPQLAADALQGPLGAGRRGRRGEQRAEKSEPRRKSHRVILHFARITMDG